MNCLSEETLSAYFDGECALLERIQADKHLIACGRCRDAFKALSRMQTGLRAQMAPSMPEDFLESLEALIPASIEERKTERNLFPLRWAELSRFALQISALGNISEDSCARRCCECGRGKGEGNSVPWTSWKMVGSISFACAVLALILWQRAAVLPEVPADLILAAHDQYSSTMPLVPRDALVARLPEEMIEDAGKPSNGF